MNTEEFVNGVWSSMVAGPRWQFERIQSPPSGRKPLPTLVEMHRWYSGLSEPDKKMVQRVVRETVEGTVYSFLMVLDHKAFVEGYGEKGELELHYRSPSGERVRLNPLGGDKGGDLESYFKAIREDARAAESEKPESV
jgi:hypothetical protein